MTARHSLLIALFFGVLGVLPHILFSLNTGMLAYMEYAWDENTYVRLAMQPYGTMLYRYLGFGAFEFIYKLSGHHLSLAMILSDFIFPAIAAIVAVAIVRLAGYARFRDIFMAASLLLVSGAVLCMGDPNFWGKWMMKISPFAMSDMPQAVRMWVPNQLVTFFPLFRTPDPQVSFVILFLTLLTLILYVERGGRHFLAGLVFLLFLMPFIYITTAIATLLTAGACGFFGFVLYRSRKYAGLMAGFATASVFYALCYFSVTEESNASGFIFSSRLPVLTPSVLMGIAGCLYVLRRNWQSIVNGKPIQERYILAMALFFVPVAVLNQQLITGHMIQAKNWELQANYYLIMLAGLLIWRDIDLSCIPQRIARFLPYTPHILVLMLVMAQVRAYDRFADRNLQAVAAADIVMSLEKKTPVLLDSPAFEAAVRNRMSAFADGLLPGHFSVIDQPHVIATGNSDAYTPATMPMREFGFEIFAKRKMTPDEVRSMFQDHIAKGTCAPELLYFFTPMDCWGELTNHRAVQEIKLAAALPLIVEDYRDYLSGARRLKFADAYFLSASEYPHLQRIKTVTVGRFGAQAMHLYAY